MKERLQKILSARGVCSRRGAEALMNQGRVTVNGAVASPGDQADPEADLICVDGHPIPEGQALVYLMLNKPRGYVTTLSDERGRPTVAQLVAGCPARVYPVGRLDCNSEGLLLLTNDGALAQALTHPSHGVEKEYLVRVSGDVAAALPLLTHPMTVEGVRYSAAAVEVRPTAEWGTSLLSVTITQGKNRQVRKMCAAAGLRVHRLKRVREGSLRLGSLGSGQWRYLQENEVELLKNGANLGQLTGQNARKF
ncbi:MAG: rRNA pseudouridine synthase [Clostridiales bacterium]|nr:rRNA pseudouridine synthase [Clostridiales bacterium]